MAADSGFFSNFTPPPTKRINHALNMKLHGVFVKQVLLTYMGVSKNRGVGPPKWMVYNGNPY